MPEVFLPDEAYLVSDDPPSRELLCPPDILCIAAGLASGVQECVGPESFPIVKVSRLPETLPCLRDPLDLPRKVELDNCKYWYDSENWGKGLKDVV